eukprot:NODE_745_length_4601_cov_0.319636.p2 type:complete len:242 gc:universal NODE_745_length_4601_cov_0.319636:1941-1216(-)
MIYELLRIVMKMMWDFIKSLDPDHASFQEYYLTKGIKDMELHAKNYESSLAIISRRLPTEISQLILIYAELNPYMLLERMGQETRGTNCDIPYLIIFVDPHIDAAPFAEERHVKRLLNCKSVTFIDFSCLAHDQGYSDFVNDHGTINNSWTFGELVVDSEDAEFRCRVYTNFHASSQYHLHENQLNFEHPFVVGINNLLRRNKGFRISFNVRALYPGWVHFVKDATIKINYLNRSLTSDQR